MTARERDRTQIERLGLLSTIILCETPMPRYRLFVAQYVHVAEAQWFAPGVSYHLPSDADDPTPVRVERHYSVQVILFPAADEEDAYRHAVAEAANETDVNFDPPGHRNVYYTLGLHELEEYPCAENFAVDLNRHGVWLTAVSPGDLDAAGVPRVRAKSELEVFRSTSQHPPAAADSES